MCCGKGSTCAPNKNIADGLTLSLNRRLTQNMLVRSIFVEDVLLTTWPMGSCIAFSLRSLQARFLGGA